MGWTHRTEGDKPIQQLCLVQERLFYAAGSVVVGLSSKVRIIDQSDF